MINFFKYFIFIIFLSSCVKNNKKSATYIDSSNKYIVTEEATDNRGGILCTFSDFNNPADVKIIGFKKDGFRNGPWNYNLNTEIKTIKWGHYKDSILPFETNVFDYTDSVQHGPWFTRFIYKLHKGSLILTISFDSPLKDSLPLVNHKKITENECAKMPLIIKAFDIKKINPTTNIYLSKIIVQKINGEVISSKGAYGFIDHHFVEFSVSRKQDNLFLSDELFNAVLTNLYVEGKLFYQPIQSP